MFLLNESLLSSSVQSQQQLSFEDYVQLSVMLQYNYRLLEKNDRQNLYKELWDRIIGKILSIIYQGL